MSGSAGENFAGAEAAATKLLRRFGLDSPRDLVLEDLAMALGVVVVHAPLLGAEARLIRQGQKGLIRVSTAIPEFGRRRFAIGHELGHWLQHRQMSQLSVCLDSDVVGYRGSREELEANAFAASLLLPGKYLRQAYPDAPSLALVRKISEELLTTVTATAVRVVETTDDPCLVIFSDLDAGRVRWWRRSIRCPTVWLERRQAVSTLSGTSEILDGSRVSSAAEPIDPAAWFRHVPEHEDLLVIEESMRLGDYPVAITLLAVDYR